MSLVFLEDLLKTEVAKMSEVAINASTSRRPSFGWGNSNDLRRFLQEKKEKHNPLIWLVPRDTTDSGFEGVFQRVCELNLCCISSDPNLPNEVRLNPERSFKKVLNPMWEELLRLIQISRMDFVEEIPTFQLIPNYKLGDQFEGQFIWDVMKVIVTVRFSESSTNCCY